MFHLPTDLRKKCDGHDVYVEREYSNNCEYEPCPTHGINPASIGDSYRGNGECWDYSAWVGEENARNRQQVIFGLPTDYFPECWWFGPDRTIDYNTAVADPDCLSLHSDEDAQLACFCNHEVWERGTIADVNEITMMDACCACGGGTSYDPDVGPPTTPPIDPPTASPTKPHTIYVVPEGGLVSTLRFSEAFYDPTVHRSSEFVILVRQAISVELEVLYSSVHILDIRPGSVIIDFHVSEESAYTAEEKKTNIAQRIFESTHTGINKHIYYGISAASVQLSSMSTSSATESSSKTGLSVAIGIGLACGLLVTVLVGFTVYKKKT